MTGRKTLSEVRAELEAALGKGPADGGQIAKSLRRFLGRGADATEAGPQRSTAGDSLPKTKNAEPGAAPDRGRKAGPGG
jgi:hypothetical protein